ncbi:hypothetical protein ACHQM5_012082 [Ranunculus cassubicifolius]
MSTKIPVPLAVVFGVGVVARVAFTSTSTSSSLPTLTSSFPPLSPPSEAGRLCPALVRLSCSLDGTTRSVSDVGFVFHSDDDTSLVWGQSLFLYEGETGTVLRNGSITVSLANSKFQDMPGSLLFVDHTCNLCIISIMTPGERLPVAIRSSVTTSRGFCLEYFPYFHGFNVSPYELKNIETEDCGVYLHSDYPLQPFPGIVLDSKNAIVGMKIGGCDIQPNLCHVLCMQAIEDSLLSKTRSLLASSSVVEDIRSPSRAPVGSVDDEGPWEEVPSLILRFFQILYDAAWDLTY